MYSPSAPTNKSSNSLSSGANASSANNSTASSALSNVPSNTTNTQNSSSITSNEYADMNAPTNHHSIIGLNQYMPNNSQSGTVSSGSTSQTPGDLSSSPSSSSYLVSSHHHHTGYSSNGSGTYIGYGTTATSGTTTGVAYAPLPAQSPQQLNTNAHHIPHHYVAATNETNPSDTYPPSK